MNMIIWIAIGVVVGASLNAQGMVGDYLATVTDWASNGLVWLAELIKGSA